MSLTPEHWRGTPSWLAQRDPRWRLLAFLLAVALVVGLRERWPSTTAFAFAVGLLGLGRVPWRWWRGRLALVVLSVAPFALVVPFTVTRGDVLWEWHFLHVTDAGLNVAALLVLKSGTISLLMFALLASAPLPVTLEAAGKLGVPSVLVHLALLTYRYLFVLLEELNRLRVALRVRAFRNRMSRHSFRTIGQVTGTLLVRGADRADRVHHAMKCRGFAGRFRTLHVYRTTSADVVFFLFVASVFGGVLAWDVCG